MAFETISPNMSLPIPGVGTTEGPVYASDLNSSLTIIDQHDHSPGRGVPITPNGLSIVADLPFNNNNATLLRSARFQNQGVAINLATDLGCIYRVGNDLYYNDGAGNQIRMTLNGSVAGSSGTITGLPSGTASASYSSGVFTFQAATNTAANIDFGSAVLRNNTANSFGITLTPPTLAANYTITLPALPASTQALNITSSGTMATISYDGIGQGMTSTGANAVAATRTRATGTTVAAGGVASSSSISTFSSSSTTLTDVTNLVVTITSSGRPIYVGLTSVGTATATPGLILSQGTTTNAISYLQLAESGGTGFSSVETIGSNTTGTPFFYSLGSFNVVHFVGAGTYTYKARVAVNLATTTVTVQNAILVAYEL